MTQQQRYDFVIDWFQQHMPEPETELDFENPFQLLVAVILSAQCTDKRVNIVTPALFARYPDAYALAEATTEELHSLIRSVSFANSKTRHLQGMARMLVADFGGEVPDHVPDLVKLPGVGRKTAHVITSVVHQAPHMAVDTHVFRVSARLGLTRNAKNPLQTEQQLVARIPKHLIHKAHHWLILHGRYTCIARKPRCPECGLREVCAWYAKSRKQAEKADGKTGMQHP